MQNLLLWWLMYNEIVRKEGNYYHWVASLSWLKFGFQLFGFIAVSHQIVNELLFHRLPSSSFLSLFAHFYVLWGLIFSADVLHRLEEIYINLVTSFQRQVKIVSLKTFRRRKGHKYVVTSFHHEIEICSRVRACKASHWPVFFIDLPDKLKDLRPNLSVEIHLANKFMLGVKLYGPWYVAQAIECVDICMILLMSNLLSGPFGFGPITDQKEIVKIFVENWLFDPIHIITTIIFIREIIWALFCDLNKAIICRSYFGISHLIDWFVGVTGETFQDMPFFKIKLQLLR